MVSPITRRFIAIAIFTAFSFITVAQPVTDAVKKENKPYRILTSGKQVTVKSAKNIKNIMVWTASGHRIVEQREINTTFYSFNAIPNEKIFFVMVQYEGSKPYTEKIGVQ